MSSTSHNNSLLQSIAVPGFLQHHGSSILFARNWFTRKVKFRESEMPAINCNTMMYEKSNKNNQWKWHLIVVFVRAKVKSRWRSDAVAASHDTAYYIRRRCSEEIRQYINCRGYRLWFRDELTDWMATIKNYVICYCLRQQTSCIGVISDTMRCNATRPAMSCWSFDQ